MTRAAPVPQAIRHPPSAISHPPPVTSPASERSNPPVDSRTDTQLMLDVRRGDVDALGVLFRRHHERVYALCFRMTGSAAAADDLVQETFLRVLKYRRGFEGRGRFTTWLYRLTHNVCLDQIRRERRQVARLQRASLATVEDPPDVEWSGEERSKALWQALQRLTPEKREALILSRFHDLRYEEIARICECSVGAVKVRVHRALKELRAALDPGAGVSWTASESGKPSSTG